MSVPRIYADFNGLVHGVVNPERRAVVIDTFESIRDLANAGLKLREGLQLIAFDHSDEDEDLEGHGTAHYDRLNGWWVVEFDELGVRYVPAGDRRAVEQFLCVQCRVELPRNHPSAILEADVTCPRCGAPVTLPIARP